VNDVRVNEMQNDEKERPLFPGENSRADFNLQLARKGVEPLTGRLFWINSALTILPSFGGYRNVKRVV
jgi:hypothetical protein